MELCAGVVHQAGQRCCWPDSRGRLVLPDQRVGKGSGRQAQKNGQLWNAKR